MPFAVFHEYWLAITPLEAEEQLRGMEYVSAPHMKKETRKNMIDRHKRTLRLMIKKPVKKMKTVADLANVFAKAMKRG